MSFNQRHWQSLVRIISAYKVSYSCLPNLEFSQIISKSQNDYVIYINKYQV